MYVLIVIKEKVFRILKYFSYNLVIRVDVKEIDLKKSRCNHVGFPSLGKV